MIKGFIKIMFYVYTFSKKKVVSDVLIVVSYPLIHILIEYCVSLARAEKISHNFTRLILYKVTLFVARFEIEIY